MSHPPQPPSLPRDLVEEDFTDVAILVVAAGRGARMGFGAPKQFRRMAGKSLLSHTLEALAAAAPGATLLTVIDASGLPAYQTAIAETSSAVRQALAAPAFGGATRLASAHAGLEKLHELAKPIKVVLIHDAARIFVTKKLVYDAIHFARSHGACAPGVAVVDTIRQVDAAGHATSTLDRARLRAIQTPQGFDFELILAAHRKAAAEAVSDVSDDAGIAERAGHSVRLFEGDPENWKITTMQDFERAESRLLANRSDVRVGQGFDVHAFCDGDHVWIGGVRIPHERGLDGHSDADVLMHAMTDALLGAIAEGDIGAHFPPSDPRWAGAASEIFLAYAAERVRQRGGVIAHVDGTLICEAPKLGPHRDAVRARLAAILDIEIERVAVKATTSERLGFTGRGEGIAAMASATVRLPG